MIRFGSVCSGIEAASVAWNPLGWHAAWVAEIEPFPCAVLAHHYPDVPNLGDMTTIARRVLTGEVEAPDILCGGTPCQAFSVAGLRNSLDDARGNLTLKFVELADAIDFSRTQRGTDPAIIFWENVPGVLSTKDNAFGCFLAGLAGEDDPLQPPGGRWSNAGAVYGPRRAVAWRTLDAQYFGVAQRRRRVFVVASARDGFDPAQVLFEWGGLRRDTAPRREAGQTTAATLDARAQGGGFPGTDGACGGHVQPVAFGGNNQRGPIEVATARNACASASGRMDFETETFLVQPTHTLRGEGFDASEDGTGRGTPLVPVCHVDTMPTMTAGGPSGSSHNQTSGQMRDQYIVPVACIHADAIGRSGDAITPSADSEGRIRLRNPGMGLIEDGTSYNLMATGQPHAVVAFDTTQITSQTNRSNPQPGDPRHPLAAGAHPPAIAFGCKASGMAGFGVGDIASTMRAMSHSGSHSNGGGQLAVAVALRGREGGGTAELGDEVQNCLRASSGGGDKPHVLTAMQVRRLTPTECERLQGFPDGYTAIPWRKKPASECPDGPRYKALGNSWAVPNVRWLGRRIQTAINAIQEAA